jgi:hypothetical protein
VRQEQLDKYYQREEEVGKLVDLAIFAVLRIRIRDRGDGKKIKIQYLGSGSGDEHPVSFFWELSINFFGLKIFKFFDAYLGSGMKKIG